MAESTMDSLEVILIDNWPGTAKLIGHSEIPVGGFTGSLHHNVPAPRYPKGEKLCVWEPGTLGCEGMATMIYLQVGTQTASIAAKMHCVTGSATDLYVVTNDPDANIIGPLTGCAMLGIALSAMTDAYYGWFWCGGVCPETFCPDLGGTHATEEGNVIAGLLCSHNCTVADKMAFGPVAADTEAIIGFALAADD